MTESQKLQLKLNQLEAEKMTVEMKITGERAKVTRLEELEAIRKELEFDIVATRNQILAERMIEEKEPSAAEKWVNSEKGHKYISVDKNLHVELWAIAGHEAGQKHQAEVERERVKPLVDAVRTHLSYCVDKSIGHLCALRDAFKNLEENEPKPIRKSFVFTGPDLELPEKPSWVDDEPASKNYKEIKDGIFSYLENKKGGYLDHNQRAIAVIIFETLQHLKLI